MLHIRSFLFSGSLLLTMHQHTTASTFQYLEEPDFGMVAMIRMWNRESSSGKRWGGLVLLGACAVPSTANTWDASSESRIAAVIGRSL